MNILFISRAYPPVIGGIEKQNLEIANSLSELCNITVIANTRGKWFLPIFLPYATTRALLAAYRYDAILLGDGVLGATGYLLKVQARKPVVCIVHGLDLTYKNVIYQRLWVKFFIKRMDKLIAVGNETIKQGTRRGIPESKFVFIPNGVTPPARHKKYTLKDLEFLIGKEPRGHILLTLGRLVRRKGICWFISNVVGTLDREITYIIAGDGAEKSNILSAIKHSHLEDRVFYIGQVSDNEKQLLLSTADIFIQPNIKVADDMEGFGLVVLEAAASGCVVIASRLEGLTDSITHGKNGFLVRSGCADEFKLKIESVLDNPQERTCISEQARKYVVCNYAWPAIARRYHELLADLGSGS